MSQLEALETITALRLLPHNVEDTVYKLGPLRVVALGPVISSSTLTKHKVVRPEDLPERSRPDAVHGAGLEVNEDGPGHVFASAGFIVIHIDPLQLEVGVAMVGAGGVDPVLVGDDLPELEKGKLIGDVAPRFLVYVETSWLLKEVNSLFEIKFFCAHCFPGYSKTRGIVRCKSGRCVEVENDHGESPPDTSATIKTTRRGKMFEATTRSGGRR